MNPSNRSEEMSGFKYDGEKLVFLALIYTNGCIAIQITTDQGEPYATLSSNLQVDILDDEFCVASWNMPKEFLDGALSTGAFEVTDKEFPTGHVVAPVWRLVCPEMLAKIAKQREAFSASASASVS
jgi:hypothetical protein